MNIIVSTMGKGLDLGVNLMGLLKGKMKIGKMGFLVADSKYFFEFSKQDHFFEKNNVSLVKEWEYTDVSKKQLPDYELIQNYENELADLTFWNSLMADRRIFFGPYCKYKQDYPSRFAYEQLLVILQQAIEQIKGLYDDIKPDVVISFGTATLGDYLIYLFAKQRQVKYRQLKATKIKNYVALNDTPCDISSHILNFYNSTETIPISILDIAGDYLDEVSQKGLKYEGAILSGRSILMKRLYGAPFNMLKSIYSNIVNQMNPVIAKDCLINLMAMIKELFSCP